MEKTIELRDVPPVLLSRLDAKAREDGLDRQTYLLRLIERELRGQDTSFDAILAPIRQDVAASGISEQKIEAFVLAEVASARRDRRERANRK